MFIDVHLHFIINPCSFAEKTMQKNFLKAFALPYILRKVFQK